ELVARCCILKTDIVARDPLEHGERMLLNWGHTWGHAVETVAGYGVILHGEAVAMGMVQAALWGERIGVTPPGIRARVARLLSQWGLPDQAPGLDSARLCAAMTRDKKATGEAITVVLLEEIGRAVLREASLQRLADWTREALA
ncbi:MAG: 3-dehydroquinate synthase, partial [Clostridia bacterium]